MLAKRYRTALRIQRLAGRANLFWFGPIFLLLLRGIGGYRCANLKAFRRKMDQIVDELGEDPVIICSNHLTMIDSMVITDFLFPMWRFIGNYRLFPWNVPEYVNFARNFLLKTMCYLGKCIFVERQGTLSSKKLTWDKVEYIVRKGDLVNIFPEGGRSRTGRVEPENAVYGIGHLLLNIPHCQVICLYLRGHHQETFSFFPKRRETFHIAAELIKPHTKLLGRRGAKDITLQVVTKIKEMEEAYFASRK